LYARVNTFSSAYTHEIGLLANVLKRTTYILSDVRSQMASLSRPLFHEQFDKTVSSALAWLSTYKPTLWIGVSHAKLF